MIISHVCIKHIMVYSKDYSYMNYRLLFPIFIFLSFLWGCKEKQSRPVAKSTQEVIAEIDSLLSVNNSAVTLESVDLYHALYLNFSVEHLIANNDSFSYFIFRNKEVENSTAIILPSEVNRFTNDLDSLLKMVSTPVSYKKSFSISNNGGLFVTASTDGTGEWKISVDLRLQRHSQCFVTKEYIEYVINTLKSCVDEHGCMKSSDYIAGAELFYSSFDKSFLARIDSMQEVIKTKSGLRYKVVKDIQGKQATLSNVVKFKTTVIEPESIYEKKVSVVSTSFNSLLSGVSEGLQLMSVGDIFILYIPSRLGLGEFGNCIVGIPPMTPLVYEVELLSIN